MDKQALYEAPDITVSYSYERSTDLNRGFLLDQNSASTSLDLHMDHRRKPVSSSGSVVEYTEYNNPSEASWTHSPSLVSPSIHSQNETTKLAPSIPVGSKSSTPCEGMNCRKHVLVSSPDLSCLDPSVSQFSWEPSLIQHGPVSPHLSLESSLVDGLTWSPRYHCPPPSLAEISSLESATPPKVNVSGEPQRSWREPVLGLSLTSAPLTEDQWHKCLTHHSPYTAKVDQSVGN